MHKRQLTKNGFFLLLVFSLWSNAMWANAEPEAIFLPNHVQIMDNGDGGGTDGNTMATGLVDNVGNCERTFMFTLRLTNLVPSSTSVQGYYVLPDPSEVPPIMLRCKVGTITEYLYPTYFEPELNGPAIAQPVFVWRQAIRFDIRKYCLLNRTSVLQSMEILTLDGEVYPIVEHAGINGIFSCEIFMETEGLCYTSAPQGGESSEGGGSESINSEDINLREFIIPIDCETLCADHDLSTNTGEHGEAGQNNEGSYISQNQPDAIGIYPNPCIDEVTLEMNIADNAPVTLTIFNTAGQEIWTQSEMADKGHYQMQVETTQWLSGIYIGQIKCGDRIETFRLSKL